MNKLLKISEFARMSGIKRKSLIFYDEIGLLSPEYRQDNGYRYYTHHQVETVSVITSLREIGMPLNEIKGYLDQRTPEALIELFTEQRENLEQKIATLRRLQSMIDTRLTVTRRGLEIDPTAIVLTRYPKELLFATEDVTGLGEDAIDDVLYDFYDFLDLNHVIYGYPFCTLVSHRNLVEKNWNSPSRFFFKFPPGENNLPTIVKPAGLYVTAYGEVKYSSSESIYIRMTDYIEREGLTIIGDAYEEFLLDEIAVMAPRSYLLQISIQVKKLPNQVLQT